MNNTLLKILQKKQKNKDYTVTEKDQKSVRWQLVYKGFFGRGFPLYGEPSCKATQQLYRAVLDRVIYDMTSGKKKDRQEVYKWLKRKKFKEDRTMTCMFAGFINTDYAFKCIDIVIKNIFPKVWKEYKSFK